VSRIRLAFASLALLVASLSILAVGCDGGDGGVEPTPVPSRFEEQLRRMVLQAEDVPSGFTVADEVFSTNQDVANEAADPEAELAKLLQRGRILGYDVTYEPGEAIGSGETIIFSLNTTASIYQSPNGAAASFADAAAEARATDWVQFFQNVENIAVEELTAPAVAVDEILWLRIRGNAEVGEQTFAHDVVLLRTGAARGSIQAGSFGTEESKGFIEGLIRAQAEHMMAAVS
jgi:hypothetical protein